MSHPGVRCHDDPGPDDLGSPAQVEVLPHGHDGRVESVELVEQVCSDQRAAARGHEHVPNCVVLSVVDLVRLDPLDYGAALVHDHSDMDELLRVVPTHHLGRHNSCVGAERLFDEEVDSVGVERDVVVADQVVGGTIDHGPDLVDRRPEPPVLIEAAHIGARKDRCHPFCQVSGLPGIEDQDRQFPIIL